MTFFRLPLVLLVQLLVIDAAAYAGQFDETGPLPADVVHDVALLRDAKQIVPRMVNGSMVFPKKETVESLLSEFGAKASGFHTGYEPYRTGAEPLFIMISWLKKQDRIHPAFIKELIPTSNDISPSERREMFLLILRIYRDSETAQDFKFLDESVGPVIVQLDNEINRIDSSISDRVRVLADYNRGQILILRNIKRDILKLTAEKWRTL